MTKPLLLQDEYTEDDMEDGGVDRTVIDSQQNQQDDYFSSFSSM